MNQNNPSEDSPLSNQDPMPELSKTNQPVGSQSAQTTQMQEPPKTRSDVDSYLASFTNYESLGNLPKDRRLIGPGRARHLLDQMKLANEATTIQIAGSKGKGSTQIWMEQALLLRGQKPGCYSSPHLLNLEERVRIAGQDCNPDDLVAALEFMHPFVEQTYSSKPNYLPSFFDLWTCLAYSIMSKYSCTHQLFEVGLGGPLDSTSAFDHDLCILTSIDLEHCEQLGDTLEEIAREKARIARKDKPFILAEPQAPWASAVEQVVESQGGKLVRVSSEDSRIPCQLPAIQQANLRTALCALEEGLRIPVFSSEEVEEICQEARFRARLEKIEHPFRVLLDGAHSPKSVKAFAQEWAQYRKDENQQACLLVAFAGDKDWEGCLRQLIPSCSADTRWLCTLANERRPLSPARIADFLKKEGFESVDIFENPQEACLRLQDASQSGLKTGLTGSFYLAGEFQKLIDSGFY